MPTKEELVQQLDALKLELQGAEKEILRQKNTAAAAEDIPPDAKALLAAISKVDIPAFWEADPVLWFRQCEAAFRRASITSSGAKFDHVLGKLPNVVSLSCRSLLLSITYEDEDGYDKLKAHLCKNFGKSKWQLGYALLDFPGLGDRRPSQLLQDMRALLPDKEPEAVLFTCLFLKRLPATMADAILAAGLDDVEDMAAMADRLFDRPAAAAAVSTLSSTRPCCQHDVAAVDAKQRRSGGQRRPARSPDRRAAGPPDNFIDWCRNGYSSSQWVKGAKKNWCVKHQFFGSKATSCEPGCAYPGN